MLAGIGRHPLLVFVACAIGGEALWDGRVHGLGSPLGDSWSGILDTVEDSVGPVVLGLALAVGAVAALIVVLRSRGGAQPADS